MQGQNFSFGEQRTNSTRNCTLPVKFPDFTASSQLISINIGEEVPVKDLLIEIGKRH